MFERMTWGKFLEGCAVPDWEWVGVLPNIVFSLGDYHVIRLSEKDITNDHEFEIIEELEDGYRIRWGNDPEDDVIVDDIGVAYIIVEGTFGPPVEMKPAFPHFFDTKEKAVGFIIEELGEVVVPLSDVMSPTEAAERWGMKRNTLIAALNRGKFDTQIERGLIKRYEPEHDRTEWYITKQAMEEVYGEEVTRVKVSEIIERRDDFPVDGESYVVGKTAKGQYFFAWGPDYPYENYVPEKNILDGESGISFHPSEEKARQAMKKAMEAWEN